MSNVASCSLSTKIEISTRGTHSYGHRISTIDEQRRNAATSTSVCGDLENNVDDPSRLHPSIDCHSDVDGVSSRGDDFARGGRVPNSATSGLTGTAQRCPAHRPHLGSSRRYWLHVVLDIKHGLVSTFLLVAGVAGGSLSSRDILLTDISGALSGAVST